MLFSYNKKIYFQFIKMGNNTIDETSATKF